jgi:hypothetical protein
MIDIALGTMGGDTAMARASTSRTMRRRPIRLIRDALMHPTARAVLGQLSVEDLNVLADADAKGQLGILAGAIMKAKNPSAQARQEDHPVAKVLAKLEPTHLQALAADCPPEGCTPK